MLVLLFEVSALVLRTAEEKASLPQAAAAELFEVTGTKKKVVYFTGPRFDAFQIYSEMSVA